MKCHCEDPEGHEFELISTEASTKIYKCPVCGRQIAETVGDPE